MSRPAHQTDPLAGHLRIAPCTVKAASRFVREWHRHLPEIQGGLFAAACETASGEVVAVGIAGNPPRAWQGTGRLVISRVAASAGGNACGMLYGALSRAADALGYREVWTYTLPHESGKTLKGSGFFDTGLTGGGEWDCPSRRRSAAKHPEPKRRWVRSPVLARICAAWRADTSFWPDSWEPANPAHGQCAVTALAVQDWLGGDIIHGIVAGVEHYWNRRGEVELDLTASQFGGSYGRCDVGRANRAALLANADTAHRYAVLVRRAGLRATQAYREAA